MNRILRSGARWFRLARWTAEKTDSAVTTFASAADAEAFLRRFAGDGTNLGILRSFAAFELQAGDVHRWRDTDVVRRVAQSLFTRAARIERVVAARSHRAEDPLSDEASEAAEEVGSEPAPSQPKTWIEIELLDMEGAPIAGERYWIKKPDDAIVEGRLDRHGRARVNGLDPGTCTVRFPDLDASAAEPQMVQAAQARVPQQAQIDVTAQVQALKSAAEFGAPFCEECERRRATGQARS